MNVCFRRFYRDYKDWERYKYGYEATLIRRSRDKSTLDFRSGFIIAIRKYSDRGYISVDSVVIPNTSRVRKIRKRDIPPAFRYDVLR